MVAVFCCVLSQVLLMPREELRFGEHHAHGVEIVQRAHAHVLDTRAERTQHVERGVHGRHEGRMRACVLGEVVAQHADANAVEVGIERRAEIGHRD